MDEMMIFLLFANDCSQIADVVKKSLEEIGIRVYLANIMDVHDPPTDFTAILFLTPGMLSVLNSSCLPDLKWLPQRSKISALFFHNTIDITAESVQEVLVKSLPSFHKWRIYQLDKKVQKLILHILELVETDDEEAVPRHSLVFYPEYEWMENQTVFISFNTERMEEDRVTVEVDKRLIEATRVNPYTFSFICEDFGAYGHQYVNVYLNEDVTFTSRVFIKDRDHILLDEISKMDSPLNYLQNILKKIKYNEGALALPTIETKILEGTKHLLNRLNEIPDDDSDTDITEEKEGHILKIEDEPCKIRNV
ncbi:uncharacterized protein LOC111121785 isoform X2 [Crassostrea virginica]